MAEVDRPVGSTGEQEQRGSEQAVPAVIVSHIDIVYRVFGAKRRGVASSQAQSSVVRRALNRGRPVSGTRDVRAIQDVSFVADHGESIGIIGRNGSGKSTLLRGVAGLLPPTKGEVYLNGTASLLGVNAVLMSSLTGERNVMIGGLALGLTPAQVRDRYDEIVEFSGIGEFINLPMSAYSSGMGARLRFAISTAAVPDVLMVDEALATGDADFRARSQKRIEQIREQAGTVFLVSHSNKTITQMCDRALWLERGRLVMDGPSEEVVEAYREHFASRRPGGAQPGRGGQIGRPRKTKGHKGGKSGKAGRGAEGGQKPAGEREAANQREQLPESAIREWP
ncbi:ABC transporter ATP-binding protein [Segeticoccus rhizosphaerae]|jgi:teichoic acid transport system ATP-binding protein|uniref:ABC transporter ATP-binding protein n=1 Tax=Segeticoccus rhizosphaerae TaxID=1104777 RepID=UPI0010C0ABE4|nr:MULTISPECIES: ABC transporter ATP-binding protein [Intrasporangiaceae]